MPRAENQGKASNCRKLLASGKKRARTGKSCQHCQNGVGCGGLVVLRRCLECVLHDYTSRKMERRSLQLELESRIPAGTRVVWGCQREANVSLDETINTSPRRTDDDVEKTKCGEEEERQEEQQHPWIQCHHLPRWQQRFSIKLIAIAK